MAPGTGWLAVTDIPTVAWLPASAPAAGMWTFTRRVAQAVPEAKRKAIGRRIAAGAGKAHKGSCRGPGWRSIRAL